MPGEVEVSVIQLGVVVLADGRQTRDRETAHVEGFAIGKGEDRTSQDLVRRGSVGLVVL